MKSQTPRERILAALSCRTTDIVPLDIGGTNVSGLNMIACTRLVNYLGRPGPLEWSYYLGQLAKMPEWLYRFIEPDVRYICAPYPSPMPAELSAPHLIDAFGVEWHQGATGLYYVHRSPLANAEAPADLQQHNWPDPSILEPVAALAASAHDLRATSSCAICLNSAASIVHTAQNLRGFENWLMDAAGNQRLFAALLDRVTDIYLATIAPLMTALAADVDLVLIADDFSGQDGPLLRPETYRRLIKPCHARLLAEIRRCSQAKILFHSCGSVDWAIPDLIDIGIDGLNPVQVSAAHMEPTRLKREFGGYVCFWGGVDTQQLLPHGSPSDVANAVRSLIETLATDGGYVVAPVHNVLPEVPPENILALVEAGHRYGGRSQGVQFRKPFMLLGS